MKQSKIAITGGIGSGKTIVSQIIREQGYKVFSCDEIYHQLLNENKVTKLIADNFKSVLLHDGTLDRKKLSNEVFGDSQKLEKLNSLTHPLIMKRVFSLMSEEAVSFCEVPLLFEANLQSLFDKVIVILRDKNQRIEEVSKRYNITQEQALLRINCQYNYEKNDFKQYYVIHNDSTLDNLCKKTLKIIDKIKNS